LRRIQVWRMESRGITIRRGVPGDIPALGRLGALMVRTHHEFDAKRFVAPTPQTEAGYGSFLGTQLETPSVAVIVAERDGSVIGYAFASVEGRDYMSLRGPAGVLQDIVVDPAHRRQGAGERLLAAAADFWKSHRMTQAVLSTAVRNEAAQRLFERAGFRRTMIEMTTELDAS
ncbi:MAG: GNAT family N-acetyltransferase, partial [Gemmatimonadaceae bacterium]